MSVSAINGKRSEQVSRSYDSLDLADIRRAFNKEYYIFGQEGAIGQVFELTPINEAMLQEEDYVRLFEELSKIFMSISATDVTVAFHAVKTSNVAIEDVSEEFPLVIRERNKFAKKLAKDGEIFSIKLYVSIRCLFDESMLPLGDKIMVKFAKAKSFMFGGSDIETAKLKSTGVKQRIDKIARSAQSLISVTKALKIKIRPLKNRAEYEQMFTDYIRPNTGRAGKISDIKQSSIHSFREQLMAGVTVKEMPDFYVHDGYISQTYELDRINPNGRVYARDIQKFLAYPMEFIYTVALSGMNQIEANQLFQKALKRSSAQMALSTNSKGELTDLSLKYDHQRLEGAYHRLSENANGAVRYSVTFTPRLRQYAVKEQMKKHSYATIDEFLFNFRNELQQQLFPLLGKSEWSVVEQGQWDVFCGTLPGLCALNGKSLKLSIDIPENVPFLIPLYTQIRTELPHYGFNHFFTNAMNIFPFVNLDPSQPSWATICCGDMGMGKSVTLNVYMAMAFTAQKVSGKRPIIRIMEFGGAQSSYFKQVKALGGDILKFNGSDLPKFQVMQLSPQMSYPKRKKLEKIVKALRNYFPEIEKENIEEKLKVSKIEEKVISFYDRVMNDGEEVNDGYLNSVSLDIFNVEYEEVREHLELKEGECSPSPQKMNTLMSILEVMLSNDPKNLNAFSIDFNRDDIEMFIKITYDRIDDRSPKLSDLEETIIDFGKRNPESGGVIGRLLRRIQKWTVKEGVYKMFDMETSVDMNNDVIMFDLFGLENNPQLEAIYLTIITDTLVKDMYEKQGRLRICLLDEVWKIAKTPAIQEVIIGFFRLSRKYKFQPIMASQLLTDFHGVSEEFGKAIVSQAKTMICCGVSSKEAKYDTLRLMGLSDEYYPQMATLGLKEANNSKNIKTFSRFLYVSIDKASTVRPAILNSILSPVEFELMNSNAEDNAITKYYLSERGMTVEEAVLAVMDGKHKGDKELIEYLRKGNFTEAIKKCQV